MSAPLDPAFDDFLDAIGESVAFLRKHPFYEQAENRASANAFLTNVVVARIEENLVWDADFPFFRVIDPRSREGADNADQRYLVSRVTGGATYRIWGKVGSARRLEFQVYAGNPYLEGGGRSASSLTFEDLDVADDGAFEVFLSPQRVSGNWLENPHDGTKIFVRQIYGAWSFDSPRKVHIDRVGSEGALSPQVTEDVLAGRLRQAAADLRSHVRVWPQVVQHFLEELAPNELGGAAGLWSFGGRAGPVDGPRHL